ncbi:MAG: hypothetical protein DRG83_16680, partial [Deltaproteobacteria bacterium]
EKEGDMKRKSLILGVAMLLLVGALPAAAAVTTNIYASGSGFLYGDTATIYVGVQNTDASDVPVDVYLARVDPTGAVAMFSPLLGFTPIDVLSPATWPALVSNFPLPAGVSASNIPIVTETFDSSMPGGTYTYFFIISQPLSSNPLSDLITYSATSYQLFATGPQGPTYHTGTITSDETWSPLGNPHIVQGTLIVAGPAPSGAVLTIQPGVVVRFDEGASVEVGETNAPGKLIAQGTQNSGIIFTSNQTVNSAGWWYHIKFNEQDSGSSLSYCTVEYGGGNDSWDSGADIVIYGASNVTISHCIIRNSKLAGIALPGESGLVQLDNNEITSNGTYGIVLYGDQVRGIAGTNSVDGNTLGGVYVKDDTVEHDATWYKLDAPYILEDILVASPAGTTLTIQSGVELRFTEEAMFEVGSSGEPGKLVAIGSQADPIVFTSSQILKTRGWWDGIRFNENAVDCQLDYVSVEYAGGDSSWDSDANVVVGTPNDVSLRNCSISNSASYGLKCMNGADPDLTGTSFSDNEREDIYIYDDTSGYHGTPLGAPTVKMPE